LAYRATLLGIKLVHAPVVRFRYEAVSETNADIDITRSQNEAEIWGTTTKGSERALQCYPRRAACGCRALLTSLSVASGEYPD
jgi:hypothetical protein